MGFLSFANFFRLIAWSFGGELHAETRNSSGFGSDAFLPEDRQRDAAERALSVACSCLTLTLLVGPALAKFELGPAWLADLPETLIAAPGALWVLRMWLPRRRPMDRAAIGVGIFTLTPWLIPFTIGILLPIDGTRLFCAVFGWQFLATLLTIGSGLALDIRAEMRAKDAPR